jgi:tRNA1Val (adenine37-N6)-methyltransferase
MMANNYFQFKAFTIYQHQCAMKVTTDACLFGAITATQFIRQTDLRLLDIGTGTGLLALMVAQKNQHANIDGAEIELAAAAQATTNIQSSSFATKITIYQTDIKEYSQNAVYDFIFTNPPFFENDLRSENDSRNKALHDATLTLEDLLLQVNRLLKNQGAFSILLPWNRTQYFINLATKTGWFCSQFVTIKQTEKHEAFRSILLFDKTNTPTNNSTIIIKQNGFYSEAFTQLLKDYYLYL